MNGVYVSGIFVWCHYVSWAWRSWVMCIMCVILSDTWWYCDGICVWWWTVSVWMDVQHDVCVSVGVRVICKLCWSEVGCIVLDVRHVVGRPTCWQVSLEMMEYLIPLHHRQVDVTVGPGELIKMVNIPSRRAVSWSMTTKWSCKEHVVCFISTAGPTTLYY